MNYTRGEWRIDGHTVYALNDNGHNAFAVSIQDGCKCDKCYGSLIYGCRYGRQRPPDFQRPGPHCRIPPHARDRDARTEAGAAHSERGR